MNLNLLVLQPLATFAIYNGLGSKSITSGISNPTLEYDRVEFLPAGLVANTLPNLL